MATRRKDEQDEIVVLQAGRALVAVAFSTERFQNELFLLTHWIKVSNMPIFVLFVHIPG